MGGGASKSSSQGATSGMGAQPGAPTGSGNRWQPNEQNGQRPINQTQQYESEDMSGPSDRSRPGEGGDDMSRGDLGSPSERIPDRSGQDNSGFTDDLQENTKDALKIPVVEDGYPPPKPAVNRRSDILRPADVKAGDKRARQVKPQDANNFEDLAKMLTKGMSRDIQQIRAIYTWVIGQNVQEIEFPANFILNSPLDILKRMKEGKTSYTTLFTLLCRAANIPCAVIHGIAKSSSYEVGQTDLGKLRNMWNAVYINGGWRFIFPLWACRAVVPCNSGGWCLLDSKGKSIAEKMPTGEGESIHAIREYFFMPDAEEFVYRCFPDKSEWQLLRTTVTKEQFIDMPFCQPPFFDYKLKLVSKPKCVLNSKDGICSISLKGALIENTMMAFDLFFNEKESGSSLPSGVNMDRYVAILQQKGYVVLSFRFPHPGVYKMDIHGVFQGDALWLCSFKLVCKNPKNDIKPFPCSSDIGFGPNVNTSFVGLHPESHCDSCISFNNRRQTEITLTMSTQMQVLTKLVHHSTDSQQLKDFVSHRKIGNQLYILLAIPHKGEYGLQIFTKRKEDKDFQNACNYLLEAMDGEKKQRNYETASKKNARTRLQESLHSKDPAFIQRSIEQFSSCGLEDNGKVQQARDRIEYLKLSKDLRDSVNRRNLEGLEESLHKAKSSKFSNKLNTLIHKAEVEVADLKKSDKHAHEILEMNLLTVTELRNYKTPKPIVHDVMKATFLLLGEREDFLEDWMDIQNLMWRIGKTALMKRIENFEKDSLDERLIRKAARCLRPYDEDMAHATSAGCGTFYVWANNVVSDYSRSSDEQQKTSSSQKQNSSYKYSSAVDTYSDDDDEGVDDDRGHSDDHYDDQYDDHHSNDDQSQPDRYVNQFTHQQEARNQRHDADDGYNS